MSENEAFASLEADLMGAEERRRALGEALDMWQGDLTDDDAERLVRAARRGLIIVSGRRSEPA